MEKTERGHRLAHPGGGLFSGIARFWAVNYLVLDALTVGALIAAFVIALSFIGGFDDWVGGIAQDSRHSLYGRVATVAGTMMGFGLAVVSFIIPAIAREERFRRVRRNPHYRMIPKTYLQTVYSFGGLTVTALICLIADAGETTSVPTTVAFLFMGLLAVARLYRSLDLLSKILRVMVARDPNDRLPDR